MIVAQMALVLPAVIGTPTLPAPVRAMRLPPSAVSVDGRLTESVWSRVERTTAFSQSQPVEGAPPGDSTVVYMAFDDGALYVAARMYDAHPDSIVARLGRRDDLTGSDQFTLFLDPYHDG